MKNPCKLPERWTRRAGPTSQHGVSLLFALMALVALSLAAIALVRSVDTGTMIMGNMSFKEDSLLGSDEATRVAVAGIATNAALFTIPPSDNGFFKTMPAGLDVTGNSKSTTRILIDWKLDGCSEHKTGTYAKCMKPAAERIDLPNGVWARYIVVRMCSPGAGSTDDCLGPVNLTISGESTERGEIKRTEDYRPKGVGASSFYQVIVRTEGTRNAVSYTETLTHTY